MDKSSCFYRSILLVFSLLVLVSASSSRADTNEIYDLIFTGCPPYVEGNHCDSIIYQVAAYDPDTGGVYQGVHYFLVDGPGEIDSLTGIWKYKPYLEEDPPHSAYVEIGAALYGDTIPSEYNCSFPVHITESRPDLELIGGIHFSVLPWDTIRVYVQPVDPDSCDVPVIDEVRLDPEPTGQYWLDEVAGELVFIPGFYDAGQSFHAYVSYHSPGDHRQDDFYFDVFRHDSIVVSLETLTEERIGDTVQVRLMVEPGPFTLGYFRFYLAIDDNLLNLLDISPGSLLAGDSCDWYHFQYGVRSDISDQLVYSIIGEAQSRFGGGQAPACYVAPNQPTELAVLTFEIRGDPDSSGDVFAPIKFYWPDCYSNVLMDSSYGSEYMPEAVFNQNGEPLEPAPVPSFVGTEPECFWHYNIANERYRNIQLHNGGVHIKAVPQPAPYQVSIGYVHDAVQGQFHDVPITLDSIDSAYGLGGFNLLVGYSGAALSFQEAFEGDLYDECEWEYFTYRFGANGPCDSTCPSGLARVVGIAETNNGSHHPSANCQMGNPGYVGDLPVTLATLRFLLTNDRTYECQFVPIGFFWAHCHDNALSDRYGSKLFISSQVYDYGNPEPITGNDVPIPTYLGAPDTCTVNPNPNHPTAMREVDFYNGGVDVMCSGIVDARGDVNLNGQAYEIADAIMFKNYFIHGIGVFPYPDGSIAASDVNRNGVPLEYDDFVYLIRVIVGDALPLPILDTASGPAYFNQFSSGAIDLVTGNSLAGAVLHFDGLVTIDNVPPTGLGADIGQNLDDSTTTIILFALDAGPSLSDGVILRVAGDGNLVEVESATYNAQPVRAIVGAPTDVDEQGSELPTDFALSQNYPNPFNPSTTIEFALPTAAQVAVTVYNVAGQRVKTLVGQTLPAGYHSIVWNGTNDGGKQVSSGVYFYRIEAGDFTQSKKMILMK